MHPSRPGESNFGSILKSDSKSISGPSLATMLIPSYIAANEKQKALLQQYTQPSSSLLKSFGDQKNIANQPGVDIANAKSESLPRQSSNQEYPQTQDVVPASSGYNASFVPAPASGLSVSPTVPFANTMQYNQPWNMVQPNNKNEQASIAESISNNFQQIIPLYAIDTPDSYSPWKTYDLSNMIQSSASPEIIPETLSNQRDDIRPTALQPQDVYETYNQQSSLLANNNQFQSTLSSPPLQQPQSIQSPNIQPQAQQTPQAPLLSPQPLPQAPQSPLQPAQNTILQYQQFQPTDLQPSALSQLEVNQPAGSVAEIVVPKQQTEAVASFVQSSNVLPTQNTLISVQQSSIPNTSKEALDEYSLPRSKTATKIEYPHPKEFGLEYLLAKKKQDLIKKQNRLFWNQKNKPLAPAYPHPVPFDVKLFSNQTSAKHEITWPIKQPMRLKVSLKENNMGKYMLNVNGPYNLYGQKINSANKQGKQPQTPQEKQQPTKPRLDYEMLTKSDRVKLLKQTYRELKMEEERKAYPLKYIPPNNRAYLAPPGQQIQTKSIQRPLVKLTHSDSKDHITLTTHLPGPDSDGKVKTLSIKLPVNVSLATVLKNIYEHMYEYYFHKRPLMNSNREDAAVRKVIQGLVDQDVRNISRIVKLDREMADSTTTNTKPYRQPKYNNMPSNIKPNTIYAPPVATKDQYLGMDQKYLKALYYKKLYNDRLRMINELGARSADARGTLRSNQGSIANEFPVDQQVLVPQWSVPSQSVFKPVTENIGIVEDDSVETNELSQRRAYEKLLAKQRLAQRRLLQEQITSTQYQKQQLTEEKNKVADANTKQNIEQDVRDFGKPTVLFNDQEAFYNKLTSQEQPTNLDQHLNIINENIVESEPTEDVRMAFNTDRRPSHRTGIRVSMNNYVSSPAITTEGVSRSNFENNIEVMKTIPTLKGPIESHLQTVELLKKNKRMKEANTLLSVILSTPLSVIADEHAKLKTGTNSKPDARQTNVRGPSVFLAGGKVLDVRYDVPKTEHKVTGFEKQGHGVNETKNAGVGAKSSESNYFLIDTSGVAENKPMVIETLEEYYAKQQKGLQRKPNISNALPANKTAKANNFSSPLLNVNNPGLSTIANNPKVMSSSKTSRTNSINTKNKESTLTSRKPSQMFANHQEKMFTKEDASLENADKRTQSVFPLKSTENRTIKNVDSNQLETATIPEMTTRYIPPIWDRAFLQHADPNGVEYEKSPQELVQEGLGELSQAISAVRHNEKKKMQKANLSSKSDINIHLPDVDQLPSNAYQTIIEEPDVVPLTKKIQNNFMSAKKPDAMTNYLSKLDGQFTGVYSGTEAYRNQAIAKGSAFTINEEIEAEKQKQGVFQPAEKSKTGTNPMDDPDWDKKHTISFDSDIISRSYTPRQTKEPLAMDQNTISDASLGFDAHGSGADVSDKMMKKPFYDPSLSTKSFIPRPITISSHSDPKIMLSRFNVPKQSMQPIVKVISKMNSPILPEYQHEIDSKDHAELRTVFDSLIHIGKPKIPANEGMHRHLERPYMRSLLQSSTWNNDQILLRRHHHLNKRMKQMKRSLKIEENSKKNHPKRKLRSKVKTFLKNYAKSHDEKQVKNFFQTLESKFSTPKNATNPIRLNGKISKKKVKNVIDKTRKENKTNSYQMQSNNKETYYSTAMPNAIAKGLNSKLPLDTITVAPKKIFSMTDKFISKRGKQKQILSLKKERMNKVDLENDKTNVDRTSWANGASIGHRKIDRASWANEARMGHGKMNRTKWTKEARIGRGKIERNNWGKAPQIDHGKTKKKKSKQTKDKFNTSQQDMVQIEIKKNIDQSEIGRMESNAQSNNLETIGNVFHDVRATKKSQLITEDIKIKKNEKNNLLFLNDDMMGTLGNSNIGQEDSFTQSMEKNKKSNILRKSRSLKIKGIL